MIDLLESGGMGETKTEGGERCRSSPSCAQKMFRHDAPETSPSRGTRRRLPFKKKPYIVYMGTTVVFKDQHSHNLHAEHAVASLFSLAMHGGSNGQAQYTPGVSRIYDAIVPQASAGE